VRSLGPAAGYRTQNSMNYRENPRMLADVQRASGQRLPDPRECICLYQADGALLEYVSVVVCLLNDAGRGVINLDKQGRGKIATEVLELPLVVFSRDLSP
jgi:hypothetical protein